MTKFEVVYTDKLGELICRAFSSHAELSNFLDHFEVRGKCRASVKEA